MKNLVRELEVGNLNLAGIKIMHFERSKNSHCFRTHWQERIEFLYMKKGEMTIEYNDKILSLKEGETAIIPPRTVHRGYTTESPAIYDALMFDVRSFYNETPICREKLPLIYEGKLTFKPITKNLEIFKTLIDISQCEKEAKMVSLVYYLLYLLVENEIESEKPLFYASIENIINYMEEHFSETLTTAKLSSVFNYSSEHFCRKFKEVTGLTPMTYLKIYRLEKAYGLLRGGNTNIGNVAAICGFDDANYFTRCFKKHFGYPPSHYI